MKDKNIIPKDIEEMYLKQFKNKMEDSISYEVRFYLDEKLLEDKTEKGFATFKEAEDFALDQLAIISQNEDKEPIELDRIRYEIAEVEEPSKDLFITSYFVKLVEELLDQGYSKEDVVKKLQETNSNIAKKDFEDLYEDIKAKREEVEEWQVNWYEDGEFLYSENGFKTKEEAIEYAKENYANQIDYNDRLINQEELSFDVTIADAISGKGFNRAKEKETDLDYEEEDFVEITNEELEELEKKDEIKKYFNNNEMVQLMPKELFEYFCEKNTEKAEDVVFKYRGFKIILECPFYAQDGYSILINGKGVYGLNIDELYNIMQNVDSKYQELLDEDEKLEYQVDKTKKAILSSIDKIDKNTELKFLAKIENDMDFYSDIYKEANGYRPRNEIGEFHRLMERKNPELYKKLKDLDYTEYLKLLKE